MLTITLILLPLAFSMIAFTIRDGRQAARFALTSSLVVFGFAVSALVVFKTSCHCNLLWEAGWFSAMGVSLRMGLDGTALLLVLMTALLLPVIIYSTFGRNYPNPSAFYGLILLMESALIGVFASYDALVFYVFWELALIPAWFICALWGGVEGPRVTMKFFIYTFAGSLFMLVAILWVYLHTPWPHSFAFEAMKSAVLSPGEQLLIFGAFFLAFAVKIPIFPFHTWQPDTYTYSPAAGTMLLAGIMLKMGLFGIIRWMVPLVPDAFPRAALPAMILGITGVVYGSVIAIRQNDLKRLVAFSSISHVGLIAAGIFTLTHHAMQGAVIQMVSHGINIVGLFFIIDIIERRTGTRDAGMLGGLAHKMPRLAIFFMIFLLGSIALPLTNGFVGELLLLLGLFEFNPVLAAIAGLTVIFSAVYMLRMFQRVMYGDPVELPSGTGDLTFTEMLALAPLALLVFWIGIYPSFFLDLTLKDLFLSTGR